MSYVGLMTGVAAFLFSHISLEDYWHPQFLIPNFPIEDFIYGFFFGGFVSECADLFIKHKFKKNHNRKIYLYSFTILSPLITFLFINIFSLNSIIVLLFLTLVISMASFIFNHKIIYLQFLSGVIGLNSYLCHFQNFINYESKIYYRKLESGKDIRSLDLWNSFRRIFICIYVGFLYNSFLRNGFR